MPDYVEFGIEWGDITTFEADVIALKHARGFYGADQAVALALGHAGVRVRDIHPAVGEHTLTDTRGALRAPQALFVGVPRLMSLDYPQIQQFGQWTLEALAAD